MPAHQLDFFAQWNPTPAQLQRAVDALPVSRERVPVSMAATILGCTRQHIHNLIQDGTLAASNIARSSETRPEYRVWVSSIRKFLVDRLEGVHT